MYYGLNYGLGGVGGLKKLTINTLMSCTKELKCDQEFICE